MSHHVSDRRFEFSNSKDRFRPGAVVDDRQLPTHKGPMLFSTADARTSIASRKNNDSGYMEAVLIILNVEI